MQTMLRFPLLVGALCSMSSMLGCEGTNHVVEASSESPLVGGRPESGYPAVGYVVGGVRLGGSPVFLGEATCGATMIAPDIAITATHCVATSRDFYGVGFGQGDVVQFGRADIDKQHII